MSRLTRTHAPVTPLSLAVALLLGLAPAARAQMPETHTVKPGDTLWDIARRYLNDPFLWPDIYRLNTMVVEDPHWIYPGEVLRLSPSETVTTVPQDTVTPAGPAGPAEADTVRPGIAELPPEEAEADTTRLFPPSRGRSLQETIAASEERPYKPLRRSEFFSSGFLTEGQELPFGRLIGPVTPSQIPAGQRGQMTLYTRVALEPPAGATYQVGDSLLIADVNKRVEGYGRVVAPTGLARVVEISQGYPIAELVALYGEVLRNQAVLPAERFNDPGAVRPVAVADGIEAEVIAWPGRRELKGAGVVLFIDKGREAGVAPGDVFELRRHPGRTRDGYVNVDELMATLQIVHVRDRTATARVLGVVSPDVPLGTRALQVGRLPT
ncbi:MAG TPA: LysM domain-containing protein [Gemmatimonadales bacterium]|nr:LysM domain-containing protein [Gemmatimonadales bacterium]